MTASLKMAFTLAFLHTETKTGDRADGEFAGKQEREQTFAVTPAS